MSSKITKTLSIYLMLLLWGITQSFAYSVYSKRFVLTVYSMNHAYYAISTPYSAIKESRLGKTEVYESQSNRLLYTIPACFTEGILYLSDDGNTLSYVIENDTHYENEHYASVTIYHHGEKYKEISHKAFDGGADTLTYFTHPHYMSGDTLHLIVSGIKQLDINLHSGEFTLKNTVFTQEYHQWQPPTIQRDTFKCPFSYIFKQANGQELSIAIANTLGMKAIDQNRNDGKYKSYRLSFSMLIDTAGKCQILKFDNPGHLPEALILKKMSSITFSTEDFPDKVDLFLFETYCFVRKKSNRIAIKEREREIEKERKAYEQRLKADSINGVYIPKDFEDAYHVLDTLLKEKDIQNILSFKDKSEMSKLHFSLGLWIRNNWGLWCGSRFNTFLQQAFGNIHPDDLSIKFLEKYYEYLQEKH